MNGKARTTKPEAGCFAAGVHEESKMEDTIGNGGKAKKEPLFEM